MIFAKRFQKPGSCLVVLLLACLTACSVSVQTEVSPERVTQPVTSPATVAEATESVTNPAPASSPTVGLATPTITPDYPIPDFVAVVPCSLLEPPGGGPLYVECRIEVYDPSTTAPVFRVAEEGNSYNFPLFSPMDNWMVYEEQSSSGQTRLRITSTDWQTDRALTDWFMGGRKTRWLKPMSWSPDGLWLAFEHYSRFGFGETGPQFNRTYIVNVSTGEIRLVGSDIGALAWDPHDSTRLAFAVGGSSTSSAGVYFVTTDNSSTQSVEILEFPESVFPISLAWRPDGTSLALSLCTTGECESHALWLIDTAASEAERLPESTTSYYYGVVWSPDGQHLASYGLHNVLIYETNQWQVCQRQRSLDVRVGSWAGNDFFLYSEATNIHGDPQVLGSNSFDLVAVSVEHSQKKIIWTPHGYVTDFGFLGMISWNMSR